MYRSCLACYGDLGTNDEIDVFPVGRLLAFDPDRGRLWVICPRCGRWNLVPLDRRWEAIERCERLFSDLPLLSDPSRVGVAGEPGKFQLYRVGVEDGDALRRRRLRDRLQRRNSLEPEVREKRPQLGPWAFASIAATVAGGFAGGAPGVAAALVVVFALGMVLLRPRRTIVARIAGHDLTDKELRNVRLVPTKEDGWALSLPGRWTVRGDKARDALNSLLPIVNRFETTDELVDKALDYRQRKGPDLEKLLSSAARRYGVNKTARVSKLRAHERLALEIGVEEDFEADMLREPPDELEAAWAEAEELAAISDELLLPTGIDRFMAMLRSDVDAPPPSLPPGHDREPARD